MFLNIDCNVDFCADNFFFRVSTIAVCISGVNGLSWIFFTSLSMAVFSMIMVTLRVAIYEY